jgi:uncharacterized membrane protein (UPF0127 family)
MISRNNFGIAGFTIAALTLAIGGMAYHAASAQSPVMASTCPAPVQTADPVPVRVHAPGEVLDLRIADSAAKREYGLMCVRVLPPRTGMIFVFSDGDNLRDFWMKNTLIPLDMIWVSKNGLVNDVAANVPSTTTDTPDTKIPHREGTGTYVIELAAGEAARAGIKPGVMLAIHGVHATRE